MTFTKYKWIIYLLSFGFPLQASAANDVRPVVIDGQIVTEGHDDGTLVVTPNVRVFPYAFGDDADSPYFTQDPGFNAATGSGLPVGSQFKFNVLSGGQFGLAANLTYWSGFGNIDFTPAPNSESFRLNIGSFNLTIGNTLGLQTGFSIGTVNGSPAPGSLHKHLNAYLRGADGNSTPAGPGSWGAGDGVQPTAGIYLLALESTSSDITIAKSKPYFLVYNNDVSEATHDQAVAWINANLVDQDQWATADGGNWGDAARWAGGLPNSNTAIARLWTNLTGNADVDLQANDRTVKVLSFNNRNASYTVKSSGPGLLLFDSDMGHASIVLVAAANSQDHAISANVRFLTDTDVAANGNTLSLSGAIDWNGKTVTVQSGTLKLNNATATNVANGSTLVLNSGAVGDLSGSSSGTSVGISRVNVSNAGTLSIMGVNQALGFIGGSGATNVGINAAASADRIQQGSLAILGNDTPGNNLSKFSLRLSLPGSAGDSALASRVGTVTIANNQATISPPPVGGYTSAQRNYFGTLDLANNDLVIDTATLADVTDMVRAGMGANLNSPTWTGTGINSSYAATGPLLGKTGLGIIRNVKNPALPSSPTNDKRYANFDGYSLAGDEILVKYTWNGDFDLDGKISSYDFALLDAGLAGALQHDGQPGWFFGDVNLDGRVNASDYNRMAIGYAAFSANGSAQLPEPSTFVLGLLGACGLWFKGRPILPRTGIRSPSDCRRGSR